MDKGVENPEEKDLLFCNVFFYYYIFLKMILTHSLHEHYELHQ